MQLQQIHEPGLTEGPPHYFFPQTNLPLKMMNTPEEMISKKEVKNKLQRDYEDLMTDELGNKKGTNQDGHPEGCNRAGKI